MTNRQSEEDGKGYWKTVGSMGGELLKREGVLFGSFQSEARSFCCFFHRFAQIYVLIVKTLLDIGFKWCFMTFFFCFERVLLAIRGCTFSLRGCSRTLKTPNSPPLVGSDVENRQVATWIMGVANGYLIMGRRGGMLEDSGWLFFFISQKSSTGFPIERRSLC